MSIDRTPNVTYLSGSQVHVCVPAEWSDEQARDYVETHGTLGRQGWRVEAGSREPCPMAERERCVHLKLMKGDQ